MRRNKEENLGNKNNLLSASMELLKRKEIKLELALR